MTQNLQINSLKRSSFSLGHLRRALTLEQATLAIFGNSRVPPRTIQNILQHQNILLVQAIKTQECFLVSPESLRPSCKANRKSISFPELLDSFLSLTNNLIFNLFILITWVDKSKQSERVY